MREILFRGKTEKGEWVKGVPFFEEDRCYIIEDLFICDEYDCTGAVNTMVIPESVSEFTGLTDKNGTKIFEGDIVQYTDEEGYYPEENCDFIGKISLEHGAFGIVTTDNIPIDLNNWCDNDNFVSLWELYWNLSVEGEMLDMVEVIGNIHDNPELLKKVDGNG